MYCIILNQGGQTGHLQLTGIQRILQLFHFLSNLFFGTVQFFFLQGLDIDLFPHRMMKTAANRARFSLLQLRTEQQNFCRQQTVQALGLLLYGFQTLFLHFIRIPYFLQQLLIRQSLRLCYFQITKQTGYQFNSRNKLGISSISLKPSLQNVLLLCQQTYFLFSPTDRLMQIILSL